MTTPAPFGSSGVAMNAAKRFPSDASSTRSSCETAAPEMTGIGGEESRSKHTVPFESRAGKSGGVDLERIDQAVGERLERLVAAHHRRRLARLGRLGSLDAPPGGWAA